MYRGYKMNIYHFRKITAILLLSMGSVGCWKASKSSSGMELISLFSLLGGGGLASLNGGSGSGSGNPDFSISSADATMGGNLRLTLNIRAFQGTHQASVYIVRNESDAVGPEFKIGDIDLVGNGTFITQAFNVAFACNRQLAQYFSPDSGYRFNGYVKVIISNPGSGLSPVEKTTSLIVSQGTSCQSSTLQFVSHPVQASQGEAVDFSVRATGGGSEEQVSIFLSTYSSYPSQAVNRHLAGTFNVTPDGTTKTTSITIPNGLVTDTSRNYYVYLVGFDNRSTRSNDMLRVYPNSPRTVTISGKIEYDHVPIAADNRLNTAGITQKPARNIQVAITGDENLASSSTQYLYSATTDNLGNYTFSNVKIYTDNFFVRARAILQKTGTPSYTISVRANNLSSSFPLEVVSTSVTASNCTGTGCTVNLVAGDNSGQTTRRNGAFAILDTVKKGVDLILTVSPNQAFPELDIFWSPINSTGSYFTRTAGSGGCNASRLNCIYLLGTRSSDSDEFDSGVVAHEFTHYLEAALSRSDSIGGRHTANDYLEPRVAYGEGLGNAMGGIINNDPIYRDSTSTGGFDINLETGTHTLGGYYSEFAIQSVIWDLFDSVSDTKNAKTDNVTIPFATIWGAVMDLKEIDKFTSFHEFISALKIRASGQVSQINDLLAMESIATSEAIESDVSVAVDSSYIDKTMVAHTCNGATAEYPYNPMVQSITSNFSATGLKGSQFCGLKSHANNKLFGSRFFTITPANSGNATILVDYTATPSPGHLLRMRSVVIHVFERGQSITLSNLSSTSSSRQGTIPVVAGRTYLLETRMNSGCLTQTCTNELYGNDGEITYNVTVTLP